MSQQVPFYGYELTIRVFYEKNPLKIHLCLISEKEP